MFTMFYRLTTGFICVLKRILNNIYLWQNFCNEKVGFIKTSIGHASPYIFCK